MNTLNTPLRIGIVGAGTNTRAKHIPGLQRLDNIEIVSVANRSYESSDRVAREFGIPRIYTSWQELVQAPDSDAIIIGTWPYLHYPVTMAALAANKHVMCEARMAMNAWEAKRMWQAARARPDLVTQVVPSPFTLHVDKTVKRLIAQGYLGEILAVEVRATSGAFLDPDSPLAWRQDADLSGLNVLSLGIWYEAIMRWVGEAVNVTAKSKTFVTMRRDPESGTMKAVRIPEHLTVLADMACGAQAQFLFSAVTGGVQSNQAILYGSEGTLRFSDGALWGIRRQEERFDQIPIPPEESGGWRVEEEFVNAVRRTAKITHTTFHDGYKYMAFTEAVARSVAQNKTIPLER